MYISEHIRYAGVNDLKIDLFEGQYAVPHGMSYHSYVLRDGQSVVFDTVDAAFSEEWLTNVTDALDSTSPDYLVVQHMEPDHSGSLAAFLSKYPQAVVVANAKTFTMMANFFPSLALEGRKHVVANGDTLSVGTHVLHFIFAPMVHWPEVMVTYEETEKVLFSADAFGKFGAAGTDEPWVEEARRYYIGIVGKYGMQVQALLRAVAQFDIQMICPLHGEVLSGDLSEYLRLYQTWSSYQPETDGTIIAYTSVYGHTRQAVAYLETRLRESGCPCVVYDLARCDMSRAVADAFRYSSLVLATTTYNADIFPPMRQFIEHLTARNYQKRKVGLIENGSWAPTAAKVMREMLSGAKDLVWIEPTVRILSSLKDDDLHSIQELAQALA